MEHAPPPLPTATSGWLCRFILVIAAVAQLSRIVQVQSATGEVPFLSANDRSRWCTIAALAVNGTYEIDEVLEIRDPHTRRRTWYTIDLVRHRGEDGEQHFYSSKPPLLATIYSGVYLAVRAATGATLMNDTFFVARLMLSLVNLLPLFVLWVLWLRWLRRQNLDAWSLIVLTFFLAWGTFLSTFVITLNNHLPASIAIGISILCIDRIAVRGDKRWQWFALCGLATSFGAASELPALSWVAAAGALLGIVHWQRTLLAYLPAMLPVAIAFFATNYLAHGVLAPAYAHRGLGEKLFEFQRPADDSLQQISPTVIANELRVRGETVSENVTIKGARRDEVFELWDATHQRRFGLRYEQPVRPGESVIGVYQWADWYDYPGSYWTSDRKQGVDRGEPKRGVYVFQSLLGHHGIFSLTPLWLLVPGGAVVIWRSSRRLKYFENHRLLVALAILATSAVAIGFYLARPLEDRNYGGVTSGFRWAFWLIPLWLWLVTPAIQAARRSWQRRGVEILVAASVFSAVFPWTNPWSSPWLMRYWEYLGWIRLEP